MNFRHEVTCFSFGRKGIGTTETYRNHGISTTFPDHEKTAWWSETVLKLLSASKDAWKWIGLTEACRRLPM